MWAIYTVKYEPPTGVCYDTVVSKRLIYPITTSYLCTYSVIVLSVNCKLLIIKSVCLVSFEYHCELIEYIINKDWHMMQHRAHSQRDHGYTMIWGRDYSAGIPKKYWTALRAVYVSWQGEKPLVVPYVPLLYSVLHQSICINLISIIFEEYNAEYYYLEIRIPYYMIKLIYWEFKSPLWYHLTTCNNLSCTF